MDALRVHTLHAIFRSHHYGKFRSSLAFCITLKKMSLEVVAGHAAKCRHRDMGRKWCCETPNARLLLGTEMPRVGKKVNAYLLRM